MVTQRRQVSLSNQVPSDPWPTLAASCSVQTFRRLLLLYLLFRERVLLTLYSMIGTVNTSRCDQAVIDCRLHLQCCHLGELPAAQTTRRVPSVGCLQRVFLRANPKAACKPNCLSLAATSSSLILCAYMTSSIKPEISNISLCRQRRTEPRPQVTCKKNL